MKLYWVVLRLAKGIVRLFYKIRVSGLENLPSGGALLASNHTSYLDPPLVAIATPEEVHFLARDTLFRGRFGSFIMKLNAHPVSDEHNLNALKLLVKLVNQGNKVVMFPEGARSLDGMIHEVKPGIGLIMSLSKKPIVPVYVEGAFAIWPREQKWPRFKGKITVHFGEPLLWDHFSHLPKGEIQQAISKALKEALEALVFSV